MISKLLAQLFGYELFIIYLIGIAGKGFIKNIL